MNDFLFIQNPNPGQGVKETTILNKYSANFRESAFAKKFVSQEGFEIGFDFVWEYTINFNRKSGFIVFREVGNVLKVFVYKDDEDLDPTLYEVRNALPVDGIKKGAERFVKLVTDIYRAHIQ